MTDSNHLPHFQKSDENMIPPPNSRILLPENLKQAPFHKREQFAVSLRKEKKQKLLVGKRRETVALKALNKNWQQTMCIFGEDSTSKSLDEMIVSILFKMKDVLKRNAQPEKEVVEGPETLAKFKKLNFNMVLDLMRELTCILEPQEIEDAVEVGTVVELTIEAEMEVGVMADLSDFVHETFMKIDSSTCDELSAEMDMAKEISKAYADLLLPIST